MIEHNRKKKQRHDRLISFLLWVLVISILLYCLGFVVVILKPLARPLQKGNLMTKVYDGVTVLTYDEWQKKPEVKEMYGETAKCSTCDGTGEHECECGDTHECGACDGSGKLIDLREMYEKELRDEIGRLHAWQEGKASKKVSGLTPRALDKWRAVAREGKSYTATCQ